MSIPARQRLMLMLRWKTVRFPALSSLGRLTGLHFMALPFLQLLHSARRSAMCCLPLMGASLPGCLIA